MPVVRDAMSPDVQSVAWDASALDAAREMADADVGALPVLDSDHAIQGVITDRDITVRVVAAGLDPARTALRDIVNAGPIVAVHADDDLDDAIEMMKGYAVRRLPVLDGPRVIGMISQADVARAMDAPDAGDLVRSISRAPGNSGEGPGG